MGRKEEIKKKFERNGKSNNFPVKLKLEDYPDYKCTLKPNRFNSIEPKKENLNTKKDLLEDNFKRFTSNYCTFYQDFNSSLDSMTSYLVRD